MKNKNILIITGFLVAIFLYTLKISIFNNPNIFIQEEDKIFVVASFYPLAEFAREVGGEKVEVINITPSGVEPHDFEPTPRDLVKIQNSKVFIYNGGGFEPWIERIVSDLEKQGIVVINTSKNLENSFGASLDPHVWLDPILVSSQVDSIKEGLIKADPENRSVYEANSKIYKNKLADLDRDFSGGLSNCIQRKVVSSHEAFGYLAKRYNLDIISISGISPDEEPTPSRMAEIAEFARINNIKYIFFESLVSSRLSETIAREVDAETLVLNPIEGLKGEDTKRGENYLSLQRQNLANLKKALNCK